MKNNGSSMFKNTNTVCSPGHGGCVGSIDGINYLYADGTTDKGMIDPWIRLKITWPQKENEVTSPDTHKG